MKTDNPIKQNTHESLASLERKGLSFYDRFTPTEIQVADLVKAGKAGKEIAAALHLSLPAVYFHPNKIRNKPGLRKQKKNLPSFLLSH